MTMRMPRRAFLGGCALVFSGCAAPRRDTISPTGSKADGRILFAVNGSRDAKRDGIWMLKNGANAQRIMAKDNAYALQYPRWVVGGGQGQTEERIAFVRANDRGIYSDLYTARADGTDQRQLTNLRSRIQPGTDINAQYNYTVQSAVVSGVSYSSGGNFLTFVTDSAPEHTKQPGDLMRLWIAEDPTAQAGSPKTHIIAATANIGQPVDSSALSPDGKYLVFTMLWQPANDPSKRTQLYLFNIATRQWRPLTETALPFGAYDPVFSPDGRFIAFAGRPDFRVNDIYIIARDGTTPPQKITETGVARAPVFSPDGKKLAFVANPDSGQFAIYSMDITPPADVASPFTFGKPDKLTDVVDWIDARSGLSWTV